jgi:hypothetical protein
MKVYLRRLFLTLALTVSYALGFAQCTIPSSGCGGYTVQVTITPTAIVPSSMTCPFGFNYNVTFDYSITVSGANTCFNGNIGIQPQIFCNSQNNGYFTINVPAPLVGTPSTNTYTGTLTTTTNPFSGGTNCATANPLNMNCNSIDVTIFGPGISTTTVSCTPPANSIATGTVSGSPFCAGAAVSVPFTATGTFNPGNVFTAQLSNASGSFASPTNIGTLTSTSSGTISATIPGATPTGSGYRIRVVSNNPATTGTDNGSNLTINATATPSVSIGITSGTNPACGGSSVTFTATPTNGGASPTYQWTRNGANIGGATSSTYIGVAGTDFVTGSQIRCVMTSNATCASPATATSAAITMTVTPSSADFYISGVTDPLACNRLEERVKWYALANVVTTGFGNSLNKTASAGNWDGGAYSYNQVNNNGYLEFTATETNTFRMIGLSNANPNNSYTSIKYAIYLQNNATLTIYENGSNIGNFGTYATNDVFRVSVENNIVKYYKNNVVFYYSALVPSFPMFVDVSINSLGGTLSNVLVNNLNAGSFTATVINGTAITYQWRLNGSPVGINAASYSNPGLAVSDIVTCDLSYTPLCGPSPVNTSSNATTLKALPTYDVPVFYITGVTDPAACNRLEEQVKWYSLANVVTTGLGNSLNKTSSGGNWDGGAFSYNQVNNNGYLEFTVTETNTARMIGLSNTNADNGYASIRYAVFLQNNATVGIYENGTNRGNFGTYAASDVFRVSIENNVVKYYRNGTVFYFSALVPSFPLYADASINSLNGTLTNVLVNNLHSGTFNATVINGAPVSYQWRLNGGPVGTNSSSYSNPGIALSDVVTCDVTYQSICSTPTISSNSTTYKALPSYDVPVFYITGVTDPAACNRLEEQVKWYSLANVVTTGLGNSLNKTSSGGNWDGGAFSYNQVNNNGYLEFTVTETNTARMIGLSNTNADNGYASIRYAIFLQNNATVGIYENGTNRGNFGTYAASDVFRVSIENNVVKYYKNGTAFYFSALAPSFPLYADVSINTLGGTLSNVLVSNLNSGDFTANIVNGTAVSYQWLLNGTPVGTNSSSYSNPGIALSDVVTCDVTYQSVCSTPSISSNATSYKALPSYDVPVFYITGVTDPAACNRLEEQVKWYSLANVVTTGLGNSLNKTSSGGNWDGGAFSYNQVNNNGYLEFTVTETNTARMIGLSNTNADNGYASIRYAIFLQNNATVGIYENGTNRGNFGTYAASDVFRVSIENNVVKYYKNATAFYFSALVPSFPLYADASINTLGGTLSNVLVSNLNSGNFTASILNGTAVSYQWLLNGAPVGTNSSSYSNPGIAISDVVTCDVTYQSICSTPSISSNTTTYKALPSYDVPVFYITGVTDPASCNRLEEQVKWYGLANVVTTGPGNSLSKTSSGGNWDGGAFSYNQVNNNGYLEFTATETNTFRMVGLSNSNSDNGYASIRYAIYLQNNATLTIYENGTNRGNFGSYAASDVFRVSVENNVVKYYKNNVSFYNSALVPSFPLFADVSINSLNGTITNALVSNLNGGDFTASILNGTAVSYQWFLNGAPVGTNSTSYSNPGIAISDVVTCDVTYQSVCSTPTISSNTTTYKSLPLYSVPSVYITGVADQSACNRLEEEVEWRSLANVATTGAGNSLNKTSSNGNWDGGAFSYNTVSNNGYLEFTATETNTSRMVGLSASNADNGYASIRYAIYLINNATIGVYENGTNRGSFGTYAASDVFRVGAENGIIKYYKNNVVFFVSSLVPSFPLFADVSIQTINGTITNAFISNLNSGSFTATLVGATPVSYQWLLNGAPVGTNSSSYTNASIAISDVVTCDIAYQSVCSTPTLSTNSTTYKALPVYGGPTFSISGVADPLGCPRAEEQIVWSALSNVVTTGLGNSLNKTVSNGNWDGGAFALNSVSNNGYLEFRASETNRSRMVGLSSTNADNGYASIRYAIYLQNNGIVGIYEAGANRGNFGAYASNALFRISVESNVVKYYRNGVLIYTSALVPSLPLFPDVSINQVGGTVTNAVVANLNAGSFVAAVSGVTPVTYQWRLNGNPVGTNSASYTDPAITIGDVVSCDLSYAVVCSAPTVSSNPITIINGVNSPALISIAAAPGNSICAGVAVTFTATPTNGGASPAYQWTRNGVDIIGETAATYVGVAGTDFFDTDLIRCVLTSNATCAIPSVVTSSAINMTVTPVVVPSVSVAITTGANPTCSGSSITFTATPTNGGTTPVYQWFLNGAPVGTNSSTYTNTSLVNGDQVTVDMTGNSPCSSPTLANGNTITMVVNPNVSPTITITEAQFNLCAGGIDYSSIATNEGLTPSYQWQLNGVDILGETNPTLTMPGLVDGDIITCDLFSSEACATPLVTSNSIVVNLTGSQTTWLGLSTTWNAPSNWSSGVPNSSVSVIIPAGTPFNPIAVAPAFAYDLTINPGATLEVAAGSVLGVYGNFTNNGTFTPNNGTLSFLNCAGTGPTIHQAGTTNGTITNFFNLTLNDASGLILNEDIVVAAILNISNGNFNTGGNIVTLTSNATRTGRIGPLTTGSFTGTITMQRFAPGGQTGWCLLGSPINTTIASWQDDFATSGFTGSTGWAGGFISIYGYDETAPNLFDDAAAYVPATNITNTINVGQGKWVYLGDGFTNTNDILIDVTGTPHTGNFDFNPTFTSSGGITEDGWNLVANPYPSAIDWDAASGWTKTNMDDAIYMYQADNGQYATYVAGVGTNGGTRFIASSQGFYVKANAANPVLQAQEIVKTSTSATLIRSEQSESTGELLRFTLDDLSNHKKDEVVLRFNANATPGFDQQFDALKFYSTLNHYSAFALQGGQENYSIFSTALLPGEEIEIPVAIRAANNGTYKISISHEQFGQNYCLTLVDLLTGVSVSLDHNAAYEFDLSSGEHNNRMVIKISNPPSIETIPGTCADANQGSIRFSGKSSDGWNYKVLGQDQKPVATGNTLSADQQLLPDGSYSILFSNQQCGEIERTFVLISDAAVSADFTSVYQGNNTWQFSLSNNPSGNCLWDFGNGETLISRQQTVTHTFSDNQLKEVSLTVDNGVCSETVKQTLGVNAQHAGAGLGIFAAENYLVIQSAFEDNATGDIKIYSASGALLLELNQTNIQPGQNKIGMPELAKGIYLVRIMSNGVQFEQKVGF